MNTYKVIVLGSSGSGKTVFLASMYNKLSVQSADMGFFVSVPPSQRRILVRKYQKIAFDPDWPPPTHRSEISEWEFTCQVQTKDLKTYPTLRFLYLDYAGENITGSGDVEDFNPDFDNEVKVADDAIYLCILDGSKIYNLMSNISNSPIGSIYVDIDNMLPTVQASRNPVHFVITKWDLLEGKYSLAAIRTHLLKYSKFNSFVQNRATQRVPLRLIPVSSVGMGFAEPQSDGSMLKTPGVIPSPFYVEMPIAHVLYDKMHMYVEELREKEKEIANQKVEVDDNWSIWDEIKINFIAEGLSWFRDVLPEDLQFADQILEGMIARVMEEPERKRQRAEERSEQLRQRREQSLTQVKDEQTAIAHVINSFDCLMNDLVMKFPESDLSNGTS